MNHQNVEEFKKAEMYELSLLMGMYNPQPLRPEKSERFYWEPCPDEVMSPDCAVQATFED